MGLAVHNSSTTMADNALVTLHAPIDDWFSFIDGSQLPSFPSKSIVNPIPRLVAQQNPMSVDVTRYGNNCEIKAAFGTVQPGTTKWASEAFLIGANRSGRAEVQATVSANNLRIPTMLRMSIEIEVIKATLDIKEIMRRGRKGS